ncbi:ABC-2 family transporter protein [Candidatus Woesearchaeota archaeon]|nr:ABC-2 family transporter protein [Candidatus Woesearchaeota archaeon]
MRFRKYLSIAKINLLNAIAYFSNAVSTAIFVGIILFVFVNLWSAIYQSKPTIEGFTLAMMIWYLLFAESVVTSERRVSKKIGQEIQTGTVAYHLNKPFSYVMFKYFSFLGEGLLSFFTTLVIGAVLAYIMIGGFEMTVFGVVLAVISGMFALTLNWLMNFSLGLFAFWLEDVEALSFVLHKVIFIIGGMLVPLDVFPSWVQVTKYLPFAYVAYHPAKLFVQFSYAGFVKVVIGQLAYIIPLFVIAYVIYALGARRVSIHGG